MLTAGIVALAAPVVARAYGWPVAPFDRQHPIRGAFGDPRIDRGKSSFHFGVDISAPDGTPVYAVAPGTVFRYPDAVAVRQPDGREFSYWHIDAAVAEHTEIERGQLLGYVRAGWGHVHLAEWNGHAYVNPLRPGGLEPYEDTTAPVVGPISASVVGDMLVATVQAYDPPPLVPPEPWQDARWAPALVRWRLLSDGIEVVPWRVAADFRAELPAAWEFDLVYAPGTTQNHPFEPGTFIFWLARGEPVAPGSYVLEVEAEDSRGNVGTASLAVDVPQSRNTTKRESRYARRAAIRRNGSSVRRSTSHRAP
jgi:hypothetical protein